MLILSVDSTAKAASVALCSDTEPLAHVFFEYGTDTFADAAFNG